MFKGVKAVIFDIDGTLMDSISRIVECIRMACESCKVQVPTPQESKNIIGLTLTEAIRQLFSDLSEEKIAEVVEAYKKIYTDYEDREPTALFDDSLTTIKKLREHGIKIGIATGKSRKGYNRVVNYANLKDLVDVSCTGDEVRSKPDSQMLRVLSDELQIPVQACVMVGDSLLDLDMATNAHVLGVGVTTGVHSREVLEKANPVCIVDSLTELADLIIKDIK